ncbi:MAG: hypothetical protein WC227_01440 [Patescibacteria group bacterium]|jgi:hypothetical protein
MNQVFYIEADEEITKVIKRMKSSDKEGVIFVIPRGSSLGQSVVNLKLLKRSARDTKKALGIVTSDSATKNLADQIGVTVFSKVSEAEKAPLDMEKAVDKAKDTANLKVNTYQKYSLGGASESAKEDEINAPEPKAEEEPEDEAAVLEAGQSEEAELSSEEEEVPEAVESRKSKVESEEAEEEVESQEQDEQTEEPIKPRKEPEAAPEFKKVKDMRRKSKKPLIILLSAVVLVALGAAYVFLPKASISLLVDSRDVSLDYKVIVDKNQDSANLEKMSFSGQIVELSKDGAKQYDATGAKDMGTKASGTITITNSLLTNQVLPAGTKVTSSDGKVFIIAKGVIAPAATLIQATCKVSLTGTVECDSNPGTIDAGVTADQNGEAYNLAVNTSFTVGKMTATNKAAFVGGLTKTQKFVTEEDLANASKDLSAKIKTDNAAEFTKLVTDSNLKVFEKSQGEEVITQSADKKANDEADVFQYSMKLKMFAVGFEESNLEEFATKYIESNILADEAVLDQKSVSTTYKFADASLANGTINLDITSAAKVGRKIDVAKIRSSLVNKSKTEAKNYLMGLPGVNEATVKATPSSLPLLPYFKNNISINFDYKTK